MSDNQYVFEIIRDVGYMIQDLKPKETVWFTVTSDDGMFHTARSSKGVPSGGLSETSRAIEKAYKVTRHCPDERDVEIAKLKEENEKLAKENLACRKNFKTSVTREDVEEAAYEMFIASIEYDCGAKPEQEDSLKRTFEIARNRYIHCKEVNGDDKET